MLATALSASRWVTIVGPASGKTNRQIAEELCVSPRTVDAHLSHIFRKLDIATWSCLAVPR